MCPGGVALELGEAEWGGYDCRPVVEFPLVLTLLLGTLNPTLSPLLVVLELLLVTPSLRPSPTPLL